MDRQNPRTNDKNKAVQTKSHKDTYTYVLTKRVKGKIYVYCCSQSTPARFWDYTLSIQVFPRFRVHQVDCGDLFAAPEAAGRDFPFSSLFAQLLGFSFGFGPASACRLPESICSSLRTGLKEQLITGLWLTWVEGREGYGMRGKPVAAEASMTLQQSEARHSFSWGSCPWITGPWPWWAAQAPVRGGVGSDLCLPTGLLVAAAAALVFHAHPWGLR